MKIVFSFLLATSLLAVTKISAQVPAVPGTGNANIGNLLGQFANGIKPSSFTDAWAGKKSGFLSGLAGIKDVAGIGKSIGSLAGFIKPGMFKSGFKVQDLVNSANSLKSMADASGLLKKFEGGLKPEAMASGWAGKRSGWLNALNLIK